MLSPRETAVLRLIGRGLFALVVFVFVSMVFNFFGDSQYVAEEQRLMGVIGLGIIGYYWLKRRRANRGDDQDS